jgi:hypothetical protein
MPKKKRKKRRKQKKKQQRLQTAAGTIQEQLDLNKQIADLQAEINRLNQQDAFGGTREFEVDPTGATVVKDKFAPALQDLFNQLSAQAGGVAGQAGAALGQGLDTSGFVPITEDFAAQRAQLEADLFNRFNELNAPLFAKQREDLEASLANRGIPVGSELFNKQIEQLEENQNQARLQAQTQAQTLAGQEQSRLQGFQSGTRQQQLGEALTLRGQPLQELGALLGLQSAIPRPQFGGIPQVGIPGVDVAGTALGFLADQTARRGQDLSLRGSLAGIKPFTDPFALARLQSQLRQNEAAFAAGLPQPGGGGGGGGGFSPGQQFIAGAAPGIGEGLGNILGDLF